MTSRPCHHWAPGTHPKHEAPSRDFARSAKRGDFFLIIGSKRRFFYLLTVIEFASGFFSYFLKKLFFLQVRQYFSGCASTAARVKRWRDEAVKSRQVDKMGKSRSCGYRTKPSESVMRKLQRVRPERWAVVYKHRNPTVLPSGLLWFLKHFRNQTSMFSVHNF